MVFLPVGPPRVDPRPKNHKHLSWYRPCTPRYSVSFFKRSNPAEQNMRVSSPSTRFLSGPPEALILVPSVRSRRRPCRPRPPRAYGVKGTFRDAKGRQHFPFCSIPVRLSRDLKSQDGGLSSLSWHQQRGFFFAMCFCAFSTSGDRRRSTCSSARLPPF